MPDPLALIFMLRFKLKLRCNEIAMVLNRPPEFIKEFFNSKMEDIKKELKQ